MSEDFHWEEIHARTGDNLAASREILKDAGTITRWSRKVREEVQRQRQTRQEERAARQQGQEAKQYEQEAKPPEAKPQEAKPPEAKPPEADPVSVSSAEAVTGEFAGTIAGEFVLVVRLELDLDLMKSPQLLRLLEGLATGQGEVEGLHLGNQISEDRPLLLEGRCPVVVDLREVKTVDGSGLSCLVAGHRLLTAAGLRLVLLLDPASQPARVFGMTNMAIIITALGSLDEL